MANQPDMAMVDEHQRTAVVVDVVIPRDGNIRKKEQVIASTPGLAFIHKGATGEFHTTFLS